ncbi:MAG: hypothetical protein ABI889_07870 [Gemmatimonadota bacterium]
MTDKNKQQKKERNSVTLDEPGDPKNVGKSLGRHGETVAKEDHEHGKGASGPKGNTGRTAGTSTARDSTGVDPQEPIDPESPNVKRGGG